MVPNIAVDEAAASWMSWAEKPPLWLHVAAGACMDEALRPCNKKPRLHNTDEALCPSKNAPSHNTGALVEASSAVAIARSHGIETEWNAVFAIGENISSNGGDGQVYQAKTLIGQKLAVLKFV